MVIIYSKIATIFTVIIIFTVVFAIKYVCLFVKLYTRKMFCIDYNSSKFNQKDINPTLIVKFIKHSNREITRTFFSM